MDRAYIRGCEGAHDDGLTKILHISVITSVGENDEILLEKNCGE